jgi:hypothetical protein
MRLHLFQKKPERAAVSPPAASGVNSPERVKRRESLARQLEFLWWYRPGPVLMHLSDLEKAGLRRAEVSRRLIEELDKKMRNRSNSKSQVLQER